MIFSAYADILYAPLIQVDGVSFQYRTYNTESKIYGTIDSTQSFPVTGINVRHLGFRLGMEGMFNRELAWTYGAELGFRPSLQTRGFYANVRVGFSFASRMQQKRQAYQVESKGK